jgi:hypothetical protein
MARRSLPLALVAVVAAVAAVAAAPAGATTVAIDSHLTPVIRLFQKRPVPASLSVNLTFTGDNGAEPPVLQQAKLEFPYGANFNGPLFPSCDPGAIADMGVKACPAGSKIGTGTAVGASSDSSIHEDIAVTLFNGAKGKSIVFYLVGNNPVNINVPFAGPFETFAGGDWHYGLTVNVPDNLQRIAGINVAVEKFDVKVGATRKVKGRKRGLVEAIVCPPGTLVPIRGTFSFADAPSVTTNSYVHCG